MHGRHKGVERRRPLNGVGADVRDGGDREIDGARAEMLEFGRGSARGLSKINEERFLPGASRDPLPMARAEMPNPGRVLGRVRHRAPATWIVAPVLISRATESRSSG